MTISDKHRLKLKLFQMVNASLDQPKGLSL